ncbi:MAG: hypothetical protein OJF51_002779 [Nitrospira sp.]|jgi:predicted RNA binding protein YcfA (HicA-like mRNA interferase family)|nr:MAG: hypothetical protein OJF51_002779 [Nitrospira sp.]
MRLPRDLSGRDLAQTLRKLGYSITRQAGSHLRLTVEFLPLDMLNRNQLV